MSKCDPTIGGGGNSILKHLTSHIGAPEALFDALGGYAESSALEKASWYRKKKGVRQILSLWLRLISLLLLIFGGLCPLVPESLVGYDFFKVGYIFLASGGGLLLFDRFFGISSSWMRFMDAATLIESRLDSFRIDWLRQRQASHGNADISPQVHFDLLAKFFADVSSIVENETKSWQIEFKSSVAQLTELAQKHRPDDH